MTSGPESPLSNVQQHHPRYNEEEVRDDECDVVCPLLAVEEGSGGSVTAVRKARGGSPKTGLLVGLVIALLIVIFVVAVTIVSVSKGKPNKAKSTIQVVTTATPVVPSAATNTTTTTTTTSATTTPQDRCSLPCQCIEASSLFVPSSAVTPGQCPQTQSCLPSPPDGGYCSFASSNAKCHVEAGATMFPGRDDIEECLGGASARAGPAIFLLGDEKAAQLVPGFRAAVVPMPVYFYTWDDSCTYGATDNLDAALQKVVRKGDIVAFSVDRAAKVVNHATGESSDGYVEAANGLQKLVVAKGATLLLISPNASPGKDGGVSIAGAYKVRLEFRQAWTRLASQTSVVTMDYQEYLCDRTSCPESIPGTKLKAILPDGLLTTTASLYLAPFFCTKLVEARLLSQPPLFINFKQAPKELIARASES